MSPLKAETLMTPARLYHLTSVETDYGGLVVTPQYEATIWGDFQPQAPVQVVTDGEVFVRQSAAFLCRSMVGLSRGRVLNLQGFDWTILSFDRNQAGVVRVRMERRHS